MTMNDFGFGVDRCNVLSILLFIQPFRYVLKNVREKLLSAFGDNLKK